MTTTSTEHKITIETSRESVRVTFKGKEIATTQRALVLYETGLPPVYYIPREDAKMEFLVRSTLVTRCPYKGFANYFDLAEDVAQGDSRSANAVWTYENPIPAAAAIANHLAFYPDRFAIERSPK